MMLENLFAQAGQERAFLWLIACGFALGATLHGANMVRRRYRLLGTLCDALTALLLLGMLLMILLRYGGGVRAYGLLGMLIGLLLYFAGVSRIVEGVVACVTKLVQRGQKSSSPKEGFRADDAEMINNTKAARKE